MASWENPLTVLYAMIFLCLTCGGGGILSWWRCYCCCRFSTVERVSCKRELAITADSSIATDHILEACHIKSRIGALGSGRRTGGGWGSGGNSLFSKDCDMIDMKIWRIIILPDYNILSTCCRTNVPIVNIYKLFLSSLLIPYSLVCWFVFIGLNTTWRGFLKWEGVPNSNFNFFESFMATIQTIYYLYKKNFLFFLHFKCNCWIAIPFCWMPVASIGGWDTCKSLVWSKLIESVLECWGGSNNWQFCSYLKSKRIVILELLDRCK